MPTHRGLVKWMMVTSIYGNSVQKIYDFQEYLAMFIICIKWKEKNLEWKSCLEQHSSFLINVYIHEKSSKDQYLCMMRLWVIFVFLYFLYVLQWAYSNRGQWINITNYTKQNLCFVRISQAIVGQFSWMMAQFSEEKHIGQPGWLAVCRQKSWLISHTCNFSASWFGIT